MKREIWDIIAAKFSGEVIEPQDQLQLDEWLNEDSNQKVYNEAKDTYEKTGLYFSLKKIDTEKAWNAVNFEPRKKLQPVRWLYRAAAVAAILLLTVSVFWMTQSEKNTWEQVVTLKDDTTRPTVILSDGTSITLNHNSQLLYPPKFKGKERRVQLKGQAFFDVAPNKEMPFVIQTNDMNVRVLGTSFDVKAYEGSETVEVKVNSGKVELYSENNSAQENSKILILFPGEMGSFHRNSKQFVKQNQFDSNSISWYTRNLKFDTVPLIQVIDILENTFGIEIVVDESVDLNRTISAKFEQQELNYVLDVIAITLGLRIEQINTTEYAIVNK